MPVEFQGTVMGDLNRRKGMILDSSQQAEDAILQSLVPLAGMFGYSTALRSNTQVSLACVVCAPCAGMRGEVGGRDSAVAASCREVPPRSHNSSPSCTAASPFRTAGQG